MSASTKVWSNNSAPSCEDDDLNGFKNENNNLIEGSGQTLNTGDNQQTNKAVAQYSMDGDFFNDTGAANAYTLSAIGAKSGPASYTDGLSVRFETANPNTGASTVNIAGLGAKAIVANGVALAASQITGRVTITFDLSNDRFELDQLGLGVLIISDEKAQNTSGGTFTSGAWQKRDLNAISINTIAGASLFDDVITLPIGNYEVEFIAPASSDSTGIDLHQARLEDTTTGPTTLVTGASVSNIQGASGNRASNNSVGIGYFTLSVQSDIELQHRCAVSSAGANGFGSAANFGTEVYAQIKITQV